MNTDEVVQRSKFLPIISVVALVAILSAGLWWPPELNFLIPKCWVKSWFGFPCPGCGLTSSFMSLARGHIIDAFKYNAAGPILYSILAVGAYDYTRKYFNRSYQPILTLKISQTVSVFFMLILLAQWVMKMIILYGG